MEKSSNKLVTLSVDFAVDILKLVKYLKEQIGAISVFFNSVFRFCCVFLSQTCEEPLFS